MRQKRPLTRVRELNVERCPLSARCGRSAKSLAFSRDSALLLTAEAQMRCGRPCHIMTRYKGSVPITAIRKLDR